MTATRTTEAAITRALSAALSAAKNAGLQVTRFMVARDGTVTVEAEQPNPMDSHSSNVQPLHPKTWKK